MQYVQNVVLCLLFCGVYRHTKMHQYPNNYVLFQHQEHDSLNDWPWSFFEWVDIVAWYVSKIKTSDIKRKWCFNVKTTLVKFIMYDAFVWEKDLITSVFSVNREKFWSSDHLGQFLRWDVVKMMCSTDQMMCHTINDM